MKKELLCAKNVSVVLKTSVHRAWTLKEHFVNFTSAPIEYLQSSHERLHILDSVSLTINEGDRIGLLGRNGAGKTTFCRCLVGLFRPTHGQVIFDGSARGIFDTSVGIYPDLSGRENVRLLIHLLYPGEAHRAQEMTEDIVSFADLGDFIDIPFKNYSNGMQARLCLALVTAHRSDLLILDEVFDGADKFFRERMAQRMMTLAHKAKGVVFVSHGLDQVARLCNRIVVLDAGKIIFDGGLDEGMQFYMGFEPEKTSPAISRML